MSQHARLVRRTSAWRARPGLALGLIAAAVLALAGCGTAAGPPPGPRITLTLSAPKDLSRVSTSMTTIDGTVKPARAKVVVMGRRVDVAHNGSFSTQVALTVGTNLIDVEASAPRSSGAATALRVVRFLLVSVPDLRGTQPGQASQALRSLGLKVAVKGSSDPFNFLFPDSTHVCSTTPAAGAKVNPGSTVTLATSKFCGF